MQRRPSLANLGGARTVADTWDEWQRQGAELANPHARVQTAVSRTRAQAAGSATGEGRTNVAQAQTAATRAAPSEE
jgi:hypothetical protein